MSVGRFDFGRGAIVECFVQALRVPLGDPVQGGDLDGSRCGPGAVSVDELGFVEAVDGLSQGVVVAVSDGSDRGLDSGGGQRIGVGQRDVVAAPIAVMDQPTPSSSAGGVWRACSRACSGSALVWRLVATAQPTILRVKTSVMNAV